MKIYTIGHSTRTIEEFISILKHYQIELVIDVRKLPRSNKFPWFNKENLEIELTKSNIKYIHYPELGGYREEGYQIFTLSKEFDNSIKKLIELIDNKTVVILCAEILWWRCHRKYITNKLVEIGYTVFHIFDKEKMQNHKLRSKDVKEKMNVKIFCDKFR